MPRVLPCFVMGAVIAAASVFALASDVRPGSGCKPLSRWGEDYARTYVEGVVQGYQVAFTDAQYAMMMIHGSNNPDLRGDESDRKAILHTVETLNAKLLTMARIGEHELTARMRRHCAAGRISVYSALDLALSDPPKPQRPPVSD